MQTAKVASNRKQGSGKALIRHPSANAPAKCKAKRNAKRKAKDKAKVSGASVPTDYMTTPEAAAYLKLSKQFLEGARYRGDDSGPVFIKLDRAVRYHRSALDTWMMAHSHAPDKPVVR